MIMLLLTSMLAEIKDIAVGEPLCQHDMVNRVGQAEDEDPWAPGHRAPLLPCARKSRAAVLCVGFCTRLKLQLVGRWGAGMPGEERQVPEELVSIYYQSPAQTPCI